MAVAAVPADVVDATGAGDLFIAAYIWADLAGHPIEERLRRATSYASLSLGRATDRQKGITLREFDDLHGSLIASDRSPDPRRADRIRRRGGRPPRAAHRDDGRTRARCHRDDPIRRGNAAPGRPTRRPRILADVDEVWRGGFDLVVVATASGAHAELADQAIDAGVAVVVDKPLATSAAAAERIVRQARARGVPLTVFQNRRWDSDFLTLRKVLADGQPGSADAPRSALRGLPGARPGGLAGERGPGRRWRRAHRPRQPPHRPGDGAVRSPAVRLCRASPPPTASRGRGRRLRLTDASPAT